MKQANEPIKDEWRVIGGRVLKGETLEQAAIRKVKEEAGLKMKLPAHRAGLAGALPVNYLEFIGYYEDMFETNPFGFSIPLHSVSAVFSASVDDQHQAILNNQSNDWKYSNEVPSIFYVKALIHHNSIEK